MLMGAACGANCLMPPTPTCTKTHCNSRLHPSQTLQSCLWCCLLLARSHQRKWTTAVAWTVGRYAWQGLPGRKYAAQHPILKKLWQLSAVKAPVVGCSGQCMHSM